MRIFSKKAFQFDHPAGDQPAVVVQPQAFADVPDWVEDSTMFKLASGEDSVMVIGSRQDEIAAETGAKGGKGGRGGKGKSGATTPEGKPDGNPEGNPEGNLEDDPGENSGSDPSSPDGENTTNG